MRALLDTRIGQLAIARGYLTLSELLGCVHECAVTGRELEDALLGTGRITAGQLREMREAVTAGGDDGIAAELERGQTMVEFALVLPMSLVPLDIEADVHLRSAAQADRVARDLSELRRQVRSRTESLARRFDRVLRILGAVLVLGLTGAVTVRAVGGDKGA